MKRFVKVIAFCLVMAMLLATPAYAEEIENRATAYFMSSTASISKVSTAKFEVYFSVCAYEIMDELGASSIKIQRSLDGENWSTMKTFSKADYYSLLICEDTALHAATVTYSGTAGYYYRAKITLYAKKGNGIGELVRYSSELLL